VWKGKHSGQDVAVKVIRTYSNDNLQRVIGVSFWFFPLSVCARTDVPCVEVLQGGYDMENPPASECPAATGSDDVRKSVRNGIRLDDERKY